MRTLVLGLIAGYQRFLSPHKGYCCAYRAHTARASCSALGYRAVRMHGVAGGLAILRGRVFLCGVAHRRYGKQRRRPPLAQRGDCDIGCADLPFDGHCGGGHGHACDFGDFANCGGCDWPWGGNSTKRPRKRRKRREEEEVHLPAARRDSRGSTH